MNIGGRIFKFTGGIVAGRMKSGGGTFGLKFGGGTDASKTSTVGEVEEAMGEGEEPPSSSTTDEFAESV